MDSETKFNSFYEKGVKAFENQSFREALHFFTQIKKIKSTPEIEDYIKGCNEKIEEAKKASEASSTDDAANQNKKDDEECEKIINSHDYYQILGITKETSNDDIKKAYKK